MAYPKYVECGYSQRELAKEKKGKKILVNLSGRGDKDIDFVLKNYPRNI